MDSWKGYNIYTSNYTKLLDLLNLSTVELGVGRFPPNLAAIPGTLNSSYNFSDTTIVIENAGQAETGSRDTEKIIFGVTSGAIILLAACWLWSNWKEMQNLLKLDGGELAEANNEHDSFNSRPPRSLFSDNTSVMQLGAWRPGKDAIASEFKHQMNTIFYPDTKSELELYEKDFAREELDGADVETVLDALQQMNHFDSRLWSNQRNTTFTQQQRDELRRDSEAALEDVRRAVDLWNQHKKYLKLSDPVTEDLDACVALMKQPPLNGTKYRQS